MEGRGTKRQSDSFSGNKAGFVSLGRPRKNSVSPQGAKVAEANVLWGSLGVVESPRRAEASSVSRENITLAVSLARRVLLEEFVSELLRLGYRCVKPTVRLLAFLIRTGF